MASGDQPGGGDFEAQVKELRTCFQTLRQAMFDLQERENASLQSYDRAETEVIDGIYAMKRGTEAAAAFDHVAQLSRANRKRRDQLISSSHSLLFRLRDAHKKISDARLGIQGEATRGEAIAEEVTRGEATVRVQDDQIAAVRADIVALTIEQKEMLDEVDRQRARLARQRCEMRALRGPHADIAARYAARRSAQEAQATELEQELADLIEERDRVTGNVGRIGIERDALQAWLAGREATVAYLEYKRDRLCEKIERYVALARRRCEQIRVFWEMIGAGDP